MSKWTYRNADGEEKEIYKPTKINLLEIYEPNILFENFEAGLTAGDLKKILQNVPDDMPICVRTLTEFFPANIIRTGTYKVYPPGCNGIAQGKEKCIRIE